MDKIYGIVLTLIAGLFFLLGGLISLKTKNKDKLNHFSVGLALIIILGLLIFDLMPEAFELLEGKKLILKILLASIFLILGIIILRILDHFIPDHHHDHKIDHDNKKEHISHMKHIGILTLISLVLHNILEGFAIFGMTDNNIRMGILTCTGVALHNIPLGTHIFSSISLNKNICLVGLLTLSSLIGGLIFLIVGEVSNLVLAIITFITMGMLIYIGVFELLPEVMQNKDNKETRIGIICGIMILIITLFI